MGLRQYKTLVKRLNEADKTAAEFVASAQEDDKMLGTPNSSCLHDYAIDALRRARRIYTRAKRARRSLTPSQIAAIYG